MSQGPNASPLKDWWDGGVPSENGHCHMGNKVTNGVQ